MSKFSILQKNNNNRTKKFSRYTVLVVIMMAIFSLIIYKLVQLQIIKADEYRYMTNQKSIRNIPIQPPRGNIIDSKGKVLAESKQGYTLTFTQTDESKKEFFNTMVKVFNILDANGETQLDKCELKTNPFRFEFPTENPDTRRRLELRFKKDRGLNEKVQKELFGKKKTEELTEEDKKKIDEKLLTITPKETFEFLMEEPYNYGIKGNEDKLAYTELFTKLKNNNSDENLNYYIDKYDIKTKDKNDDKIFKELFGKMDKDGTFNSLAKKYNVKTDRYSLDLKRRFFLVKDTINLQRFSGFKPAEIATNIKKSTAFLFMQKYQELPGIEITMNPIRVYPYKEIGGSFIGYLSKIDVEQQEKYEEKGYDASIDYIGKAGIEQSFENFLKGSKGTKIVQINKYGRIMKELGRKEPYQGNTIQLTIDTELQNVAEKTLDKVMEDLQRVGSGGRDDTTNATRGAAVVQDVKTGKILALASEPGYDPNLFAVPGRLTPELQSKYFNPDLKTFGKEYVTNLLRRSGDARAAYGNKSIDEIVDEMFPLDKTIKNNTTIRQDTYDLYPKPLYNYATKTLVPPGSTFKPVVGLAALEEGVLRVGETIYDGLQFTKHGYKGKDWNTYSFGYVDLAKSLEKSINYFFFEMGDRLFNTKKYNGGFDAIANYAWKFGLGAPRGTKAATGIEIPERFGQVYNLETGKDVLSALYMNSLVKYLKVGTDARTPNYKPHYVGVDISESDTDNKEVKEIKSNLRKKIVSQMINQTKEVNDVKKVFLELEQKDEKQKKKYKDGYEQYLKTYSGDASKKMDYNKYLKEQVDGATMAVIYTVADANSNIYNQNNVYDASIGQGTNQFTPVQLANYMATLVNGGTRYKVHLVDKILDQDGKIVKEYKPEVIEKNDFNPQYIDAVKRGMKRVTTGAGTGSTAFVGFPISNGGKTGSATFSAIEKQLGRTTYAVFAGFAPYENPEIAVSVIIFDGGSGGNVGEVARAVYEKYFEETLKKDYPGYTPKYSYDLPKVNGEKDTKQTSETQKNDKAQKTN